MLADAAGARGVEILDPGGRRDTIPAAVAVVAVGCCDTSGGVVSWGMVAEGADVRKVMVPLVVLVGTERRCATVATAGRDNWTCLQAMDAAGPSSFSSAIGIYLVSRTGHEYALCRTRGTQGYKIIEVVVHVVNTVFVA